MIFQTILGGIPCQENRLLVYRAEALGATKPSYSESRAAKLALEASVAFTDVVKDGQEYMEGKMHGFPETATGDRFEGDEYRFLIVASKFQGKGLENNRDVRV